MGQTSQSAIWRDNPRGRQWGPKEDGGFKTVLEGDAQGAVNLVNWYTGLDK